MIALLPAMEGMFITQRYIPSDEWLSEKHLVRRGDIALLSFNASTLASRMKR